MGPWTSTSDLQTGRSRKKKKRWQRRSQQRPARFFHSRFGWKQRNIVAPSVNVAVFLFGIFFFFFLLQVQTLEALRATKEVSSLTGWFFFSLNDSLKKGQTFLIKLLKVFCGKLCRTFLQVRSWTPLFFLPSCEAEALSSSGKRDEDFLNAEVL